MRRGNILIDATYVKFELARVIVSRLILESYCWLMPRVVHASHADTALLDISAIA